MGLTNLQYRVPHSYQRLPIYYIGSLMIKLLFATLILIGYQFVKLLINTVFVILKIFG